MTIQKESTAPNERFRKMAAVTPQKRQCEFARYYPAASLVEAATSQSRRDVSSKWGRGNHKRLKATTCSRSKRAEQKNISLKSVAENPKVLPNV